MSNNESPENFVAGLPIAAPVSASGGVDLPLPAPSLLSIAERARLDDLARTGELPVEPVQIPSQDITTFSDGSALKWFPRVGSDTQCVLVEATGIQIAIAKDVNFAELICNAVNLMVIASLKYEGPLQILTKPIVVPSASPSEN